MNGNDVVFPQSYRIPGSSTVVGPSGLTKREYIATMAMQGIIARMVDEAIWSDCSYGKLAEQAVRQADALIAELSKEGGK